jgi:hypothetical protein
MESVAAFVWNGWQLCRGISGRVHLESMAALPWNTHRPLKRHTPLSPILALDYAQKLSPPINVALVLCLEVFRQHIDRVVSPPPLAAH